MRFRRLALFLRGQLVETPDEVSYVDPISPHSAFILSKLVLVIHGELERISGL